MFEVIRLETPGLGDRSYIAHDGEIAVVVDPQRDIDRVLVAARQADVRIALVAETHMHNDYVTGGLDLAQRVGAEYLVHAADEVGFTRHPVRPGDEVEAGSLRVAVIATPGHTPTHLAFSIAEAGVTRAVFTGGSMLYGAVGRTDLAGADLTDRLTRDQWRSVRRLAADLSPEVEVFPTHGFGSFCSSAKTSGSSTSTVGQERAENVACLTDDEDEFVRSLLSGLTAYPRYYTHMGDINRNGPAPWHLTPPDTLDAAAVRRRIHAGEWVVDLRGRRAFAGGHLKGSIGVELGDQFATYLGWIIPWGTPVTLLGGSEEVAEAQVALAQIGIDRVAGAGTRAVEQLAAGAPLSAYEVLDFPGAAAALNNADRDAVILDVRRDDERAASRITGAVHIPLQDLEARMDEVPHRPLLVHCGTGFRAGIAAGLLDRAGRDVVLIDDEFVNAAPAGMPVEVGPALSRV